MAMSLQLGVSLGKIYKFIPVSSVGHEISLNLQSICLEEDYSAFFLGIDDALLLKLTDVLQRLITVDTEACTYII